MKSFVQVFVSSAARFATAAAVAAAFAVTPIVSQAEARPGEDSFSALAGEQSWLGADSFSPSSDWSALQSAISQGGGAAYTLESSVERGFGFDHGDRTGGWSSIRGSWNDPGAGWGDHGAWGGGGWMGDHGGGWDDRRYVYSAVPELTSSTLTILGVAAVFFLVRRTGLGSLRTRR